MPLFVASWKMYQTFDKSIAFAQEHYKELETLAAQNPLVLMPSFLCLDAFARIFKNSKVAIGAQNCASHESGAYTGEVDAKSLAQVGCTYALVGHSERRHLFHETDKIVAAKLEQLFFNNITPIICIGETVQEARAGQTLQSLEKQVNSLLPVLQSALSRYYIAYEPVSAIGTDKIPELSEIETTLEWLTAKLNNDVNASFLYGGSVNETNAASLLALEGLSGLLIGRASCNFQSLKKIVSLG